MHIFHSKRALDVWHGIELPGFILGICGFIFLPAYKHSYWSLFSNLSGVTSLHVGNGVTFQILLKYSVCNLINCQSLDIPAELLQKSWQMSKYRSEGSDVSFQHFRKKELFSAYCKWTAQAITFLFSEAGQLYSTNSLTECIADKQYLLVRLLGLHNIIQFVKNVFIF